MNCRSDEPARTVQPGRHCFDAGEPGAAFRAPRDARGGHIQEAELTRLAGMHVAPSKPPKVTTSGSPHLSPDRLADAAN